jgi:hypothetical protein
MVRRRDSRLVAGRVQCRRCERVSRERPGGRGIVGDHLRRELELGQRSIRRCSDLFDDSVVHDIEVTFDQGRIRTR